MKLKLMLLILTYFINTTSAKTKFVFNRAYFSYVNKSRIDVAELKMVHFNKTLSVLSCKWHFIHQISHLAKVNIKAYFLRNNLPLFSGIQFDVPLCKAMSSNAFGTRDVLKDLLKGRHTCPIKPGWYVGNFRFDSIYPPYGAPVAKYMVNATLVEDADLIWTASLWFEIIEDV